MGFFGKRKSILGLDIGSSAIKACELTPVKGGGYQVVALGIEPLAPEAIVDGTILDSAVVLDAISKLVQEHRIKTKDVATAVSGNSVIIKKITLPAMTPEELAESIQWEAEQYIPFDIEDVNIDYQILDQGAENMEVLLVAVKKDKITDYTQVISQAGLNPVIVEVDAFAMQHAFEANYEAGPDEVVALVNLGASIMNINILRDGSSMFWRDISSGGNKYTEEIQRELHLSQEQAEDVKRGRQVEGVPAQNAQPVIDHVTTEIATEIQKTFDFFMATSNTERIHRIVLSGGTSKIGQLENVLAERFGAAVEILNPFERIEIDAKKVEPDEAAEDANQYGIAVGLATRALNDSHINLLREKRTGGAAAGKPAAARTGDSLQPIHFAFMGIILAAVGYIGVDWYRLNRTTNLLADDITRLEAQKKRLQPILEEKNQLEKKREALDQKINVIQSLRAKQQGPVRMLDEISKSLPDYVWFSNIEERDFLIQMRGYALNANKVADFVENLKRSGYFKITDGPTYTANPTGVTEFSLETNFSIPEPPGAKVVEADTSTKKRRKKT